MWQRSAGHGPSTASDLGYWRRQLAGMPALELPTDRPRPPVRTTSGAVHRHELPADLAERPRQPGDRYEGATAVHDPDRRGARCCSPATATSRTSRSAPSTAGRDRPSWRTSSGSSSTPWSCAPRSTPHASRSTEFLSEVRETVLDGVRPRRGAVRPRGRGARPERDPSRTPLVQALVVLQNAMVPTAGGRRAADHRARLCRARRPRFDLVVEFCPVATCSDVAIEYNTDLFDAATMERMTGHLLVLLAGIAAGPHRPLARAAAADATTERRQRARGVERHRAGRARGDLAGPVRGAGGADTGRHRRGLRRRPAHLRGGERACQPAGAPADRPGVGPERCVALALPRSADLVVARWRCSRPAPRTCRSTSATRPSGSRSCRRCPARTGADHPDRPAACPGGPARLVLDEPADRRAHSPGPPDGRPSRTPNGCGRSSAATRLT